MKYTDFSRRGSSLDEYPWCEKSEYIAECEEYRETDDDIHHPSFCLFRLLFAIAAPCPEYTSTDDGQYSEEHDDIDYPSDDLTEHILECSESLTDSTLILTSLDFTTVCSWCTDTVRSWYFLCREYFCRTGIAAV